MELQRSHQFQEFSLEKRGLLQLQQHLLGIETPSSVNTRGHAHFTTD
ncbi:hypothetical protein VIG_001682 [Vibrio cholerae INDRE 91/1]|nr:hypothetical protein VIG_001682 [Vibrio cholerae INDRE 91/1]